MGALDPNGASSVDLLPVLCTVIKGHSPPSYVHLPAIAVARPRAIVEAWQKEVLAWRTGLFTEAMNDGRTRTAATIPSSTQARASTSWASRIRPDRSAAAPRSRRASRAAGGGRAHGLRPPQLQYARELDVLNCLALSLRRTEEDKLGLDSGAQVRDIQRSRKPGYALLATPSTCFPRSSSGSSSRTRMACDLAHPSTAEPGL